ncbi:BQ5605_C017g08374 [Microbotryum silenes-dioicae]|uniref:BQ5605_C017g08374 protein n=1 Tax=Microbotryum silenes-dioicae TaxID=796604 RepID=A0A2X0LZ46_9BASI|nr:BQ5605_C017g08374 [Microbotryum silenes-dioicae]
MSSLGPSMTTYRSTTDLTSCYSDERTCRAKICRPSERARPARCRRQNLYKPHKCHRGNKELNFSKKEV